MGPSFPMWTRSRDAKSVTSVHSAGEGAKNSPGKRRGEPYTSSADEAFKSFYALRISSRTNGRASVLCSWVWRIRAAFRRRYSLSIMSFGAGCHAVVQDRENPAMAARFLTRWDSNCLSWSVMICWGLPIRATQTETKALESASAVTSERSVSGQRVNLSMAVRQCRRSEETGSDPTRSICT